MKIQISILIILTITAGFTEGNDSECKQNIAKQLLNGQLIADSLTYSGKYLNELGDEETCELNPNQTYYLNIFQIGSNKYVMGSCTLNSCTPDQVRAFDTLLMLSGIQTTLPEANVTYKNPDTQFESIKQSYLPGYYVMISLLSTSGLLCILGVMVQYTNIGNITDKSRNLQVQFQGETEGKQQYIELLAQADKILLNRKKIWAIFFLCFSIPRNIMILFYDTQKAGKVSFIRVLKVIGFIWVSFDITVYVAFKTYPINFDNNLSLTTSPVMVMMISGIIYGFSIVYFHSGFSQMYDRLLTQYLKKQPMNVLLFILRNYLYFVMPIIVITAIMITIMPFVGSGPIYYESINDIFLQNCASYWWTNILLINNFYPWDFQSLCGNQLTYISNQFQMIAILIPFFVMVYRHAYRKILLTMFLLVGIGGSLIPVVYMTLYYDVNSYPGFQSNGTNNMFFRLYFRIPPFLMGIAFAIFYFEYKYVDKLNDGSKPFHKDFIDRVKGKIKFKVVCYVLGVFLQLLPIFILMGDTACVHNNLTFCWGNVGSSIYNSTGQMIFFAGLTLVLLPCAINNSDVLRPLMSSHLWHVLEELTYSAFLIQFLVVVWFFASRSQNTLISISYIFHVTISSCLVSYMIGVPFYLLVERPFKNFLDLILFPKSSIFKKKKDLDSEDSSSTDEDEDAAGPDGLPQDDSTPTLTQTTNMKDTMMTATMLTTQDNNMPSPKHRPRNQKSKCRFCQNEDDMCQCDCMVTKKACECVRKCEVHERFSRNFKKEDIKNLFSNKPRKRFRCGPEPINQSNDMRETSTFFKNSSEIGGQKKVSFDFQNKLS